MKLTYKLWNFVGIVSTSLFSWEDQNWVWHSRYIGELCCILLVPWCKKVLVIAVPSGFFSCYNYSQQYWKNVTFENVGKLPLYQVGDARTAEVGVYQVWNKHIATLEKMQIDAFMIPKSTRRVPALEPQLFARINFVTNPYVAIWHKLDDIK